MIKSKFVDILTAFTEDEFSDFGKYVISPYFNTNKKLITAFGFFRKYSGRLNSSGCTKEKLYEDVFPGTNYRDSEVRKILSGLTKLAEGFLSQKAMENDIFERKIGLAGKFISKGLISPAEKLVAELEQAASNEKINGQHSFYELMRIQAKKKTIELNKESFQTGDITEDKINTFLLNYFISFSTKIVQNIKAKQYYNLISEDTELTKFISYVDTDSFISWLKMNKSEYSETLTMNLCIIKCINNEYTKDTYMKLKALLLENHPLYSKPEICNLFTCLQGIQINRYRENDPDALSEIFEVNNLILKYEAYSDFPGGNINYGTFVTMVTIGIANKEYGWTQDFISKYTNLLNEKHRNSLFNYAMAELLYATGSTKESMKHTSKIEYEGFFMKHEVNMLKLKIFYAENDFISIHFQLDTYRKLVEGNKYVGEFQHNIYSNFLKVFTELVKIKENEDKIGQALLLKKIENTTNLLAKEWLLEKVKDLN
ncbi:MAG: hypothetical protein IAE90_07655 [Ignavibacteria bacterium]|nr:hypothetical protein [Ignavibacteria bacterium]